MCYASSPILIAISDTPANERGPRHTKPILAAIHKAASRRFPISFIFGRHAQAVGLYIRFPDRLASLIKGQFHAKYPDCQIEQVSNDALDPSEADQTWEIELRLRPEIFPILRYQQYEDALKAELDDPVGGVLQSLVPEARTVRATIELIAVPASHRRTHAAHRAVERLTTRRSSFVSTAALPVGMPSPLVADHVLSDYWRRSLRSCSHALVPTELPPMNSTSLRRVSMRAKKTSRLRL